MSNRTRNLMSKTLIQSAACLLLAVAATAVVTPGHAQVERYVAGTHYIEIENPVRTRDASKVEVVEVFWYGCPSCFTFEPLINDWVANAPSHVDFHRFPAIWNSLMRIHAQAYYTAEALDVVDTMHEHIFAAIHVERNRLQNLSRLTDLFARHGVSAADFDRAFKSFSVRTRLNQVVSRMSAYQVSGTPAMVVNGKYLVSVNDAVRSQQAMLEVVDFLVAKERLAMRRATE